MSRQEENLFEYLDNLKINDENFRRDCDTESMQIEIAELLREYRKEKNLSQYDVAKKSGLTRQMVSKVETYTSSPTLATLVKYLNALEINMYDLLKKQLYKM